MFTECKLLYLDEFYAINSGSLAVEFIFQFVTGRDFSITFNETNNIICLSY